MSDIGSLPGMNSAMSAAIAVMQAAQQMAANTATIVAPVQTTPDGRTPLPYSQVLDKLA